MLAVSCKRPEIEAFGEMPPSPGRRIPIVTTPLDVLLRIAGVAIALVFLLVVAVRGGWRQRTDLLLVVACAAAYLVCSAPTRPCCGTPVALPLLLGAITFPFALWRLARVVLDDERRIAPVAWAGLLILLGSGWLAASDYLEIPTSARMAAAVLNKLAGFGFLGAALYRAWSSWDGDLVEPRRKLRWALIAYLGAYGLMIMLAEVYLLGERPPAWLDLANAAAIDLTMLATLLFLVQPRHAAMDTLFAPKSPEPPPAPSTPKPEPADEPLLERLHQLIDGQKLYREPDLSVDSLAKRVAVPEYVLRRLIHERLGYRNFAAYVNEFRLQEVAGRLSDPKLARRPILTLALEAGFGSIGPFNRAFRDRYGVTPTAFRVAAMGGSRALDEGSTQTPAGAASS
ncbi:MAG TPA: helix-turn-helix transcriptional regulator [Burkholderiaceae bacterium]|nr:helix-turn-helix transcriptional regulator [Burkholderiaceae bacterium]